MFLQAFPQGSSLLPYISRAILNVTEDKDKFGGIEEKYFSSTPCEDQSATISSQSLGLYSFGAYSSSQLSLPRPHSWFICLSSFAHIGLL
jgi:hypothetical protein